MYAYLNKFLSVQYSVLGGSCERSCMQLCGRRSFLSLRVACCLQRFKNGQGIGILQYGVWWMVCSVH